MTEELWKDIKGFEGLYEISNKGRLRSHWKKSPMIKRPVVVGTYHSTCLTSKDTEGRNKYPRYIHRLVAEHFIPNPENLPLVMHLDDNGFNNCVENLKWGTHKENTHDMISKERHRKVNTQETKDKIRNSLKNIHKVDGKFRKDPLTGRFKPRNSSIGF